MREEEVRRRMKNRGQTRRGSNKVLSNEEDLDLGAYLMLSGLSPSPSETSLQGT